MPWTVQHKRTGGAIFDVIATFEDDGKSATVVLPCSVNFESPGSVDDFIARCHAAKDEANKADEALTKYAEVFAKLEAQLNG